MKPAGASVARTLRGDAAAYGALRLLSGLLSFTLFALVARWFDAGAAKSIYYFLFLAGFFTSALRVLASVAAGLQGPERRTEKLRRALAAYGSVAGAALLLLGPALWVLSAPGVPSWVGAAVVALVLLWGFDVDLLRAVVGRRSLVAPAAAAGGVLAIGSLAVWCTPDAAFAAVLLQWLPLCALQAALAWRLRRGIAAALRTLWAMRGRGLAGLLVLALFDGLVINAPFFLGALTPPELGRSIGVVTRLFVAALVLQPLVMYWSNARTMARVAARLHTTPARAFWLLALGAGLVAGSAFALAFALIAASRPSVAEGAAALLLLAAYVSYATAQRYRGAGGAGRAGGLRAVLPLLALLNLGGVALVLQAGASALGVAMVQAGTLAAATLLLGAAGRRTAEPSA